MGQWGRGGHRGGTTNGKTLIMTQAQVLGPKLHKHFKTFHRKDGKGEDIGTFLLYSVKVQAFKVQPSKLLSISHLEKLQQFRKYSNVTFSLLS